MTGHGTTPGTLVGVVAALRHRLWLATDSAEASSVRIRHCTYINNTNRFAEVYLQDGPITPLESSYSDPY
ncbi:hypothetical protein WJX74_002640 [Apatococcus lobatus]|uniref:Uncharacterized protein n=2 Tax=Apatococcus TaxID=904362 RepID=A0AAW1RF00_9CHLO